MAAWVAMAGCLEAVEVDDLGGGGTFVMLVLPSIMQGSSGCGIVLLRRVLSTPVGADSFCPGTLDQSPRGRDPQLL